MKTMRSQVVETMPPRAVAGSETAFDAAIPAWLPWSRRRDLLLSILAFGLVVAAISYRVLTNLNVPGQPEAPRWGLVDFRDVIYYPVVSFLDGHNPYDAVAYLRTYPVAAPFALYGPHTLVVHLLLGLLPLRAAEFVYYAMTLSLTPLLALVVLRLCDLAATPARVFGLAALILLSRPGESTLFLGQYTTTVVLGMYLALQYAQRRPWLAGLGVAIAALKPTFGVPLVILLLVSGTVRAVVIGVAIAAALAVVPTAMLVGQAGGLAAFLRVLQENRSVFSTGQHFVPATSVTRIDAVALAGRLVGTPLGDPVECGITLAILLLGVLGVRRLSHSANPASRQMLFALTCLTVLTCVYHQGYDALLLAQPLVALSTGRIASAGLFSRPLQSMLVALLAVPAFNYVGTYAAVGALGITGWPELVVASLNAIALLLALLICAALAFRRAPAAHRSNRLLRGEPQSHAG
jgi:glycosyl transferase family 87